jgi:hypothetical protein
MKCGWRVVVLIAAALLVSVACAAPPKNTASLSPATTPSPSPSPSPDALVITAPSVHPGEVGVMYAAVNWSATGGVAPYAWSLGGGALPGGLSISSSGTISGKATKAGNFTFTVRATDSVGTIATIQSSIKIYAALTVTPRCANVCNVGIECSTCGSLGSMTGGAPPYRYQLMAGTIPAGMTWSALALEGGWPKSGSTSWSMTVQVSDQFGVTKTVSARWHVFKEISFFGTSPYAGCYGPTPPSCVNTDVHYTPGNPSDTVQVKVVQACYDDATATYLCTKDPTKFSTYLPPGWFAKAKGGVVTVGMNCGTKCSNFYGDVYFVLVDRGSCVASSHSTTSIEAQVNIDV